MAFKYFVLFLVVGNSPPTQVPTTYASLEVCQSAFAATKLAMMDTWQDAKDKGVVGICAPVAR